MQLMVPYTKGTIVKVIKQKHDCAYYFKYIKSNFKRLFLKFSVKNAAKLMTV